MPPSAQGSYLVEQPHEEHGQAGIQHVVEGDEPVFIRSLGGDYRVCHQPGNTGSLVNMHSSALSKPGCPQVEGGFCPTSTPADGMSLILCNGQNKKTIP